MISKEEKSKKYWKEQAFYDWEKSKKEGNYLERLFFKKKIDYILSAVNYEEKDVLDIGCSTGFCTFDIARRSNTVVGVDISKWAIDIANQRLKNLKLNNVKFVQGDAEKLDFKKSNFDIIVNTALLQYFSDPTKIINQMDRVLKKGGKLIVEVPYTYGPYQLKSIIKHLTSKDDFGHEPINRCYSKKEVKDYFSRFKIINIHNFYNTLLIGTFMKI